jgi:hypothetical protein
MALKFEGGKPSKLQNTLQELSKTAHAINAESDRLTKTIETLEGALRALNLGVSGWVKFDEWSSETTRVGHYEIGYDRFYNQWGLGIRSVESRGEGTSETRRDWPFNGAPRDLRLQAVGHLGELLDDLNSKAAKIAKHLSEKTKIAEELAAAFDVDSVGSKEGK